MIEIRAAGRTDAAAVLAFWALAAEDAHRPADSVAAVERLLERDPAALLLAYDGDELIGTVIAGWDGWRAHVYRLAVHPDRRRQGIGTRLLAAVEERFVELGGGRSDAMVLDDNAAAHGAWTSAGYHRQPEWSRWVKPLHR